jgi:hypothetical protein
MLAKKINPFILLTSQTLRLVIIIYLLSLLAKSIWWLATPSLDSYLEEDNLSKYEHSIKYIINRAPFGVPLLPPPSPSKVVPKDQISLTGVYVDGNNSIAFFEVNGKPLIAKIKDKVVDGSTLYKVNYTQAVLLRESQEITLNLTGGSQEINPLPSPPSSPLKPNVFNPMENVPSSPPPYHRSIPKEERRKLIEEFLKYNSYPKGLSERREERREAQYESRRLEMAPELERES